MAERLVKFDNAKLILIVLVVAGHFIETFIFGFAPGSAFASGTFTFIYSFHMPLFIFISGLFLRDMDEQTSFPVRRVAMLITLGFAMKVVRAIFGYVVNGHTSFDLFSDSATPWFMFTLAACYALAWLLRLQNRAAVLVMALLIGLFVGYDQTIGDFLYLSRTIVFFPFFWTGYCLQPTRVEVFTSKPAVRLTAALIVMVFAAACIFATWQVTPLRFLFAGRLPFAETGIPGCGWYTRALSYLVQFAMCFGIFNSDTQPRDSAGDTVWNTVAANLFLAFHSNSNPGGSRAFPVAVSPAARFDLASIGGCGSDYCGIVPGLASLRVAT